MDSRSMRHLAKPTDRVVWFRDRQQLLPTQLSNPWGGSPGQCTRWMADIEGTITKMKKCLANPGTHYDKITGTCTATNYD